jgi:hypothetical protein
MTPAERAQTIKDLLDLQRDDGGWSLKSLGDWKRTVAKANDEPAESDGFATGLILYVLRQASVPATREPMRRGVDWLKTHQRASGCWFTRSVRADGEHHIANAGTAFALMALKACGVVGRLASGLFGGMSPFLFLSPFLASRSAGEDKWLWSGMSCTAPGGNPPTRGELRGGAECAGRTRTHVSLHASVRRHRSVVLRIIHS